MESLGSLKRRLNMRIIIEDTQTTATAQTSFQMEGGAPVGQLLEALTGATTEQPVGLGERLQDAGTPPRWLSEAIRKAFEQDPGRFDIGASSEGESDAASDASDGGGAPEVDE
jgi:hypothetical protein